MFRKDYFLISGVISIFLYLSFFIFLFIYLKDHNVKKYDASKKVTVLELEVIEPNKEKSEKKQIQKVEVKNNQKNDIVEKSTSTSQKQRSDLKSLFANVNVKSTQVKEEETTDVKKSSVLSRFKSKFEREKKSQNVDVSNLLQKVQTNSNLAIATTSNNFDEYYSKIYDIISSRWNPLKIANGLSSVVIITIDSQGNFSYKIITRSGDDRFDASLEEFLDSQTTQAYPPYEKGNNTDIEFTFKTKED